MKTDPVQVILIITLLAYGCSTQAIVVAFGFDERIVKDWGQRVGQHCQQVPQHWVANNQLSTLGMTASRMRLV